MLKTIGFDKGYVRGEGSYLWDEAGHKYLDLLTGWRQDQAVRIAGTLLARIVGGSRMAVNSAHHQAVDRPGAGAVVNAVFSVSLTFVFQRSRSSRAPTSANRRAA